MHTQPSLPIHDLAAQINRADAPRAAAEPLVRWLKQHLCPALVGLLDTASASLDLAASPDYQPPAQAAAWMQSADTWLIWQTWHEPHWLDALDENSRPAGLENAAQALLIPLRYEDTLYGLLWLDAGEHAPPRPEIEPAVVLLAHLLAARLHHLAVNTRWDTLLTSVNTFSRALAQESSSEDMWRAIHHQIAVLFDTSSFFVGLLNPYTSQLTLPLYSENGAQIYYGTVPLSGLSRTVIQHGTPLHFRDLEAEQARLASLNVVFDDDAPNIQARSWLGVPLRSRRGEVIGLVSIQNILPDVYADPDLYLLIFIAGQIAFAIESRRLLQAEHERRKVVNTLMEVSQVVNATLHYEEVLERILEQMQRVVACDSASIMLPAPGCDDGSRMLISATSGASPAARGDELRLSSTSPGMLVYQSQQPLVIGDIHNYVGWSPSLPVTMRARSWMGVPLRFQERVIGLITLDKDTPNYYTETDASTVFALARQAAVAVENARLHAQSEAHRHSLEQRARRLASMHSIATMLSASLDRDVVLNTAARLMTELFEVDHCGIVLLDLRDGSAALVAEHPSTGSVGMRIPAQGSPIFEQLIREGRAIAINDTADQQAVDDETRSTIQRVGAQSTLLAPLFARSQLIGSIGLDMTTHVRIFSPEEQETFMTIAAQVALAINNAQLYEEAIAINRLKSELLSNISHELRTPLNAIIGYSEMLLSQVYGDLNAKQYDRLARVHTGGKHLLNLINDVLDLSKIEAGQLHLALTPLAISEVIYDIIADLSPKAQAKGLNIALNAAPDLPHIRADALRLRQILTNLLDNAIKFTDTGGVTVGARVVTSRDGCIQADDVRPPQSNLADGDWLMLSVSDTGIGIGADEQRFIFEAFRQVDSSSIRRYEGTGLGLTIAHQLVKMHQGLIWVESEPGQGSIFYVLLPLDPPEERVIPETPANDADRPVVLVIDDDPAALQLVQDYLSLDIYQVIGTTNPAQALEIARKVHPAAIITDIMMPTMNGWEVLRTLKNDKQTADIPVIILSVVEQKAVGFYLGAADYLLKPINRESLQEALEHAARIEPKEPILVVDDNLDDRSFLVDLLERAGYTVAQVESGQAALDWLAQQTASIILLDLMLPDMTGFEVLEQLRSSPATAGIPVIIITGADVTSDRLETLHAPVLQKGAMSGNSLMRQIQLEINRSLHRRFHP